MPNIRLPSRCIPPLTHPPLGYRLGATLLAFPLFGLSWALYAVPMKALFAAALIALVWAWSAFDLKREKRRLTALAFDRTGVTIREFARHFERRMVDTWIIRVTHQEVLAALAHNVEKFPLRANDLLVGELGIDPEDLEDIAEDIAARTGRSFADPKKNPYHGKVVSVADLVMFLNAQPKL